MTRIKEDTKAAMKAKEQAKLTTIRFLSSAIKNREIELRQEGKEVTERDALEVVQKLVKQSKQVIDDFRAAGRPESAEEEELKVKVWEAYLPAPLSDAELEALVDAAVADIGATSVKQMGQVMKLVVERAENRADNKKISELVKAKLSGK